MKLEKSEILSNLVDATIVAIVCDCEESDLIMSLCQKCYTPFPEKLIKTRGFINRMNCAGWTTATGPWPVEKL
jgi:hypothetical protein